MFQDVIYLLLLQFLLSCIFVSALLIPAGRLLKQEQLDFRRSLQSGLGFALFQLTSVLLFMLSVYYIRSTIYAPDTMRLGLIWVCIPLFLIAPVVISFTTGWRRAVSITSSTAITLCWAGLQYGVGMFLMRGA